jgi:N-methylhydantoinase B
VYTPILVKTRRLVPDSEGAGRYRGAPAILVEFGPVGGRMEAGFVADGNINNPKGARRGLPAAPAAQRMLRRNGQEEDLPQYCQIWVEDGEFLVSVAGGGGGYGDPRTRDPQRVLDDVREGLVTPERAERVYGVALTPDGIDQARTQALRAAQAAS